MPSLNIRLFSKLGLVAELDRKGKRGNLVNSVHFERSGGIGRDHKFGQYSPYNTHDF
jgi:hypothetical protein